MKRLYIIIAAIIAILILGIVLILNYNNIFNINNKDIVDSKDTIDINKIINKDAITFNVDKTNIGESKVKINIAVQYEDNLSYCCYPINWEFVNIDKTKYNGSNTQTGVDIIKKAGIGNFELLFLNAENIPDDLELVINKIMVVLNAFNEDEKNKIYDEYNLEGEWKISINLK